MVILPSTMLVLKVPSSQQDSCYWRDVLQVSNSACVSECQSSCVWCMALAAIACVSVCEYCMCLCVWLSTFVLNVK